MKQANGKRREKVAFICSYPPRRCGIATFSYDLISAIREASSGGFEPLVVAVDSGLGHQYHEPVRMVISRDRKLDYVRAAEYINSMDDVVAVSVQHEFGLYGGPAGSYLGTLLRNLDKPIISTLHTVLETPSSEYYSAMYDVCRESARVVVMNERGIGMLCRGYSAARHKIELIPHGIPDRPFRSTADYKQKLGLTDRKVILTFGLLSPNKGIEFMLRAMPAIVEAHPDVLYIVLGTTHPEVVRGEGLSYKSQLEDIVAQLSLQDNVVFAHRFVDLPELLDYLGAADLYVTPYLHTEQLTSGTLAMAVGMGKAVVSTPYWAAQELLAEGRGRLVPCASSEHLASCIGQVLGDDRALAEMRRRSYEYGRAMTWSRVGGSYRTLFARPFLTGAIPTGYVDSSKRPAPVSQERAVGDLAGTT